MKIAKKINTNTLLLLGLFLISGGAIAEDHYSKYNNMDKESFIKYITNSTSLYNSVGCELSDIGGHKMRKDKGVILEAVRKNGLAIRFAEIKDKAISLAAVQQNGLVLMHSEHNDDKKVVRAAVKEDGYALRSASKRLINEKDFIFSLVKDNYLASIVAISQFHYQGRFKEVHLALAKDKNAVLIAAKNHPSSLYFADASLKNDKDLVLEVVAAKGSALKFASDDLKNDRDIVLQAVKTDASALEYASTTLKNDADIIWAAINTNSKDAFKFASHSLKNDRAIVLSVLEKSGEVYSELSADLKEEKALLLAAIKTFPTAYEFAPKSLQKDRDVLLTTLNHPDSYALQLPALKTAMDNFKHDKIVVTALLKNKGEL